MPDLKTPQSIVDLPLAILKNMITLATSGFGLVVALAWNEAIKGFVQQYIDPYLGKNSGLISLFIYAVAMTLLAIFVTMQLSLLERKFEEIQNLVVKRKK